MSSFYERLIRLCAEKKTYPSTVANEIGLSRAAANGWKKGKIPFDSTLEKLASYFDVDKEYLMGKDIIEETLIAVDNSLEDESYKDLLTLIALSTKEERQELVKYLQYLQSKREGEIL